MPANNHCHAFEVPTRLKNGVGIVKLTAVRTIVNDDGGYF